MLECTIYFIRCPELNAIKIGQAEHPHKRLIEMQTGCPAQLVLHGQFRTKMGDERKLHLRFRELRIRGEWFKETKELLGEVDELIANGMPQQTQEQADEFDRLVRAIHAPIDDAAWAIEFAAMSPPDR